MNMNAAQDRVLVIVDDEPQVLTALTDILEDTYQVFAHTSPAEALETLDKGPPVAAVISDQRMPEMAGDAFLAQVRERSAAMRILLTGYADLNGVVRAINDGGIFGYVAKPWNPDALKMMVDNAVAHFELKCALVHERTLLRNLLESSSDAIVFKDCNHRFVRINRVEAEALGLSNPEAAVGRTCANFMPPARAHAVAVEEERIFSSGEAVADRIDQILGPDGARRWISTSKAPILSESGKVEGLVSIARDITERQNAQEALAESEAQLRQAQKMEAIGRLTGGVAHDFNNLLTVIMGNLDVIASAVTGRAREAAESALKASEKGAALTHRLLAYARKQTLHPQVLDLNGLIAGMEDLLRRTLVGPTDIRIECGADVPPVQADKEQLENALLNLAINARDAMPTGGILTIATAPVQAIGIWDEDAMPGAALIVSDTGFGMSPEVLRRATEPFFTTKEIGQGSGLGLSMIDGFARQSGGALEIESREGHGTTVRLYLPGARERDAQSSPAMQSSDEPGGTETILVVEDMDDVRRLVSAQLEALGYSVIEACDSARACEILQGETRVDLLFTDLVGPGSLSGRQLIATARRIRPGLKALLTSGYFGDNNDAAVPAPNEQVLPKPYRRRHLAEAVRRVLDAAEPRSPLRYGNGSTRGGPTIC